MNILFTSAGRRVALIEIFKNNLDKDDKLFAIDCDPTAPGLYVVDVGIIVPKVNTTNYIPSLKQIIQTYNIKLLIPLLDTELPILAKNKPELELFGTTVMISSPQMVKIAFDKYQTYLTCKENNIPVPITYLFGLIGREDFKNLNFPVIVKPRFGSASIGVHKCDDLEELIFYGKRIRDLLVQEYVEGYEVTADVLFGLKNELLSYVLRKRIKIRAGEVERGMTIKDSRIFDLIEIFAKTFQFQGPINIQFFITDRGPILTEINPRFGGGYPLSYYAGINFPKMIMNMINGIEVKPNFNYREDYLMLRYDDAIYIDKKNLL